MNKHQNNCVKNECIAYSEHLFPAKGTTRNRSPEISLKEPELFQENKQTNKTRKTHWEFHMVLIAPGRRKTRKRTRRRGREGGDEKRERKRGGGRK